jgi:hypothetical protein
MPVAAAGANCAGISEYGAKLACQTQNRRGCGTSLERALFKAASRDGNVFVQEVGKFGSLSEACRLDHRVDRGQNERADRQGRDPGRSSEGGISNAGVLDKGQDRNWYFDLTKPANIPLYVVSRPARRG